MKKILLLALCFYSVSLFSQVEIFRADFEDENMEGWLVDDLDGDSLNWELVLSSAQAEEQGWGADGTIMLGSFGFDIFNYVELNPDNIIVTPKINLPESYGYSMSFKVGTNVDYLYDHNFSVYVVEDYQTFDSLWTPIYEKNFTGIDSAVNVELDLSQFAGSEVRIVFRHYSSKGQFVLLLDDLLIEQQLDYIFYADFEDQNMEGWLVDDLDGDSLNWELVLSSAQAEGQGWGADGTIMLGSFGFDIFNYVELNPDNIIVTPKINLPEDYRYNMSFKVGTNVDYLFDHNFSVYVVEDYKTFDSLWTPIYEKNFTGIDSAVNVELDLSQFADSEFRIVFRHYNSTGQFVLLLDDIIIEKTTRTANIVATVEPVESGVVEGAGVYDVDSVAVLRAVANQDFRFVNWTENGEVVSSDAEYTFTVDSARTLVANFKSTVSVNSVLSNSGINIYPNPVADILKVNTQKVVSKIDIFNSEGKLVSSTNSKDVNVSNLSLGAFLVKVYTEDGVYVQQIIKK